MAPLPVSPSFMVTLMIVEALFAIPAGLVLRRIGHSMWWALLCFVPLAALAGLVSCGDGVESSPATLVQALRENVRSRFQAVLGDRPYAGILVALAVGDQRAIDQGLWLQFARTGLTHLLSVSGLHITLVAGLAYALVNALWRRSARLASGNGGWRGLGRRRYRSSAAL